MKRLFCFKPEDKYSSTTNEGDFSATASDNTGQSSRITLHYVGLLKKPNGELPLPFIFFHFSLVCHEHTQ